MKTEIRDQRSEVEPRGSVWSAVALAPLCPGAHSLAAGRAGCPQPAVDPWAVLAARSSHRALPVGLRFAFFCFLLSPFCFVAHAQYAIDWFTIDGGGSTSTGGVYLVSGTIGQPDAGTLSGGNFTLTGGFWALPGLVQTPGAPTLYITNAAPGWATIWWSPPTPGFLLQESLSVFATNWGNSLSAATNPVVIPATFPARFYRLHKP